MFQILGILDKTGSGILFSIVSGVYSTVARIYDIMIDLVRESDKMFQIGISNLLDIAYVIAGVFMLFRVMVAMIQYFINPDQISDGSAGTGKLITRIVISIVLLILLKPSGLVLGEDGILKKIERAVLAEDGVITRIIDSKPVNDFESYDYGRNPGNGNSGNGNGTNTSTPGVTSCYYWEFTADELNTGQRTAEIKRYYRIDFSKNQVNNGKHFSKITNSNNWYYYSYGSNVRVGGENGPKNRDTGKSLYYTKFNDLNSMKVKDDSNNKSYFYKSSSNFNTCPKALIPKSYTGGGLVRFPVSSEPAYDASVMINDEYPKYFYADGLYGGKTSVNAMMEHAEKVMGARKSSWGVIYDSNADGVDEADTEYLTNLKNRGKAVDFSQTVAGTFLECSSDIDCEEIKSNMLSSSNGYNEVVENMGNDKITLDFFTSVIVGIVLILYLLVLCVDIIVRRLKLIFMEMLSPIPIVAFVDPKDKIFNEWYKTYLSTYFDLFIKLIAMGLLITLLDKDNLSALWGTGAGPIVKFFYIVAILVFAKAVPSMLSNILGIKMSGSSFKDIVGMAKGAAGFGAGAAIGGAVGLASGFGKGGGFGMAAKGALKGTVMGAASGSKGKFLGGAESVRNANVKTKAANRTGSTAMGRFGTNTKRFFGQLDDYEAEKNSIAAARLDLDKEKYDTAKEKEAKILPLQEEKGVFDRRLTIIAAFEKKVESNFDKGKYNGKGIVEVDDYNLAVNTLETLLADRQAGKAVSDEAILNARNNVSSLKGKAMDAAKEYEITNRVDGEAAANLEVLETMVGTVSQFSQFDNTKKTAKTESIRIGGQIEAINQSYVAVEQSQARRGADLAEQERINENSAAKANHDAVGKS